MTELTGEQVGMFDQDIWSGRTFAEHSVPTTARTSALSSKKRQKSQTKMPLFLDLRGGGQTPGAYWETGGALLGEYTTHSFGEYPNEENVSRLSQILEACPHPRYALSARACAGIIARAERRGKELPPELLTALQRQLVSKNAPESRGGGKGILIQNEHVGALSTLNNQAVLGFDPFSSRYAGETFEDQSVTITNNHPMGVYCVDQGAGKSTCGVDQDRTPTLATTHGGAPAVVQVLNDQGGNIMGVTEDVSGTLRAQEHGHQPIVSYGIKESCGAICARDYKGPGNQYIDEDKLILQRPVSYFGEGSFGTYSNDCATLRAHCGSLGGGSETLVTSQSVVRRLTPKECERLQGFPDEWTNIGAWTDSKGKLHKETLDTPRYKALGNSIALPFWFWILRRISAQYERPATLGSLFDGIGGFPLCWERCNGKGTALWASEIEDFPIAVTKYHFPE